MPRLVPAVLENLCCPYCRAVTEHSLVVSAAEVMAWCQRCFRVRILTAAAPAGAPRRRRP